MASKVLRVGGVATHTYCLHTEAVHAVRPKIVVIPGNPGMIDFYRSFMHSLFNALGGQHAIFGVSHAGHVQLNEEELGDGGAEERSPTSSGVEWKVPSDGVFSLNDQILHKHAYLVEHVLERAEEELILVAHSVGSYIALKLMQSNKFNIVRTVHMFPTFQRLYEGLAFPVRLAIQPLLRQLACALGGVIPSSIFRFFVARNDGLGEDAKEIVCSNMNHYRVLSNIFYMAYTETQQIRALDHALLSGAVERSSFIYSPVDQYTPLSQIDHFRAAFPSAAVHMTGEHIRHAFCTKEEEASEVAETVASFISGDGQG